MATDTSDGLSTAVPRTGLGRRRRPRDARASRPPPATLEEARNAPGRAEQIERAHAADRGRGHQVRLLPAGLDHRPRHGQGRRRVVLPAGRRAAATSSSTARPPTCSPTAPATTSASGRRSPSSRRSPTSTPSRCCPWDPRVARVYCDCYDTETGELLDADPRQNLKRVAHEFEQELGYQFLIGIEPEMMWLKTPERRRGARGRHQALLLPHPPVRGAPSGAARRGRLRPGAGPRHELRRPRGRARPARAELPLRPRRCGRPTTSPPTARSARRSARKHGLLRDASCPSRSPACRPTGITTTSR